MGQARDAFSTGLSYVNLDVRGGVFVQLFLLTLIRDLIGRRWSMFDVDREKERSIAHKKFNITNQTSIQHLQIFSIKDSLQCTDIDLMMYRNGSRMYRSRTTKNTCTKIDLICTEVVMYRNCPPLCTETVMYRKRPNPVFRPDQDPRNSKTVLQ